MHLVFQSIWYMSGTYVALQRTLPVGIGPKWTNFREDLGYLLHVMFRWNPFCGLVEEVENMKSLIKERKKKRYNVIKRADRENKMTALASDWLKYFRLFNWNRWMEFDQTWQEA